MAHHHKSKSTPNKYPLKPFTINTLQNKYELKAFILNTLSAFHPEGGQQPLT